jgi:tripartite-type tricarboxylate transporter receptor subunit TctC
VVGDRPVELEGFGTIPPITQSIPSFRAATNYFGIFVPKGVPAEVTATLEKIWAEKIANSAALKQYAVSRGAVFAPSAGEEAQKRAMPAIQANSWLMFDAGKAKVSPDTVGIPKPQS